MISPCIKQLSRVLLLFACVAANAGEVIKIGVLAYQPMHVLERSWGKLGRVIDQEFEHHSVEVVFLDSEKLNEAVARRSVDFVFTTSGNYIFLKHRFGLSVPLTMLVKEHEGKILGAYGGVIFTRSHKSNINTLKDLEGKKIATIGSPGLGGFKLQAFEMLEAGLSPPSQQNLFVTAQPHDNVVNAVLKGDAEIGFVRTGVLERMAANGTLDLEDVKIINAHDLPGYPFASSTRLYPEWPFAALPHVDNDLTRKITGFLLSIEHIVEIH